MLIKSNLMHEVLITMIFCGRVLNSKTPNVNTIIYAGAAKMRAIFAQRQKQIILV